MKITDAPLLVVLSALLLAACPSKVFAMTPVDNQRIEILTNQMTPRCIGRYLIDLPDGFTLNNITTTKLEGVIVGIKPMPRGQFDLMLSKREAELRRMHMDGKPNRPALKRVEATPSVQIGKIFNRVEATGSAEFGRTLELQAWRDGYSIAMTINATDGSDLEIDPTIVGTPFENSARRVLNEYKTVNDTSQKLAHLLNVFERTRGRTDDEVPTEKGICFANGFLRGAPTNREWIDLYYHLSTAEDVYFGFHYLSHVGPEKDTLLERSKAINESLAKLNGRTMRKGKRQTNGLAFEEWLTEQESDPGVKDYDLTLELNSKTGNAMAPLFTMDFYSGVRHPHQRLSLEQVAIQKPITRATLGDVESVRLWDKVTSTLRPRPGAF